MVSAIFNRVVSLFFENKFGEMKITQLHLHQFFTIITYQERQRDWPCEALATTSSKIGERC